MASSLFLQLNGGYSTPGPVGIGTTSLTAGADLTVNGAASISGATVKASSVTYTTFVGLSSGAVNTGDANTGFGEKTLLSTTTGHHNTAVGTHAMWTNIVGNFNTALGHDALFAATADENTGLGYKAGAAVTTGEKITAVGANALLKNTDGQSNTAIGAYAGQSLTTGDNNVVVGADALYSNSTANNNTAIGHYALFTATGGSNTAVGESALVDSTSGASNVAIGVSAAKSNTEGNNNVALGNSALYTNTTGVGNVALGFNAGKYETGSNAFYVDNQDRTNTAGDKAKALLYGVFATTAAAQSLTVNAGHIQMPALAQYANDTAAKAGTPALVAGDLYINSTSKAIVVVQ